MLQTAGTLPSQVFGAGWYRDPADRKGARFHDGQTWTKDTQPGASRMLGSRTRHARPRAAQTRQELNNHHALSRWSWLGQYADVYL